VQVTVNQDYCEHAGECIRLAPAVFSENADGNTVALVGPVPSAVEDDVRTASEYCPRLAVIITD
jgi:ferredoxin